jgi:hypothetical protein
MKKYIINIIILLMISLDGCADRSLFTEPVIDPGVGGIYTEIGGEITGTLSKSDSPFLVTDNISVNTGTILTIEPGVVIFFRNQTGLYIQGGIKASGTKENRIRFQAFDEGWDGIHATDPTDSLIFNFCRVIDVYLPIASSLTFGAIDCENAKLIVRNCYFNYNYSNAGGGLALYNCNSEIINNIFDANDVLYYGGAILSQNSSNKIINNTFYDNYSSSYGGAIVLVDPVYEEIQNNIFFDNFSYSGDRRILLFSGDSANVFEQYNYMDPDSLNPLFISTTDFHLQQNSPCKDAGNPAPEFDDADGSRNDQGAYGGPGGNW